MITIKKAKKESRKRDQIRDRYLLVIGKKSIHLTAYELLGINDQINSLLWGFPSHFDNVTLRKTA